MRILILLSAAIVSASCATTWATHFTPHNDLAKLDVWLATVTGSKLTALWGSTDLGTCKAYRDAFVRGGTVATPCTVAVVESNPTPSTHHAILADWRKSGMLTGGTLLVAFDTPDACKGVLETLSKADGWGPGVSCRPVAIRTR